MFDLIFSELSASDSAELPDSAEPPDAPEPEVLMIDATDTKPIPRRPASTRGVPPPPDWCTKGSMSSKLHGVWSATAKVVACDVNIRGNSLKLKQRGIFSMAFIPSQQVRLKSETILIFTCCKKTNTLLFESKAINSTKCLTTALSRDIIEANERIPNASSHLHLQPVSEGLP